MNTLIIFCAKYLLFVSAAIGLITFLVIDKESKIKTFWLAAIASILSLTLARVSSLIFNDPRPFVVKNIQPLIQHSADNGFPSDHTLAAALIALIVFSYNKKVGIALMILAVLVGVSRVLAQIHHPLDIIGSILIVLISVLLGSLILKRLPRPPASQ